MILLKEEITKAFKHCGTYIKLDDPGNHIVEIRKSQIYKSPARADKYKNENVAKETEEKKGKQKIQQQVFVLNNKIFSKNS